MSIPGQLENDGLAGAHGGLMIIAWLFISEFAEVIAWWCRCKVSTFETVPSLRGLKTHHEHQLTCL